MALKIITFTVGANEIDPVTIQDGGIQGDHKKTELRFNFNDELYNHLQTLGLSGKLVYRFDATDGEGTVHHSDTENLTGRSVSYPLEYTVTCHGGLVKVELIISLINGENTSEVIHTESAQLKLSFNSFSTRDKSQGYTDMSTLAEIAKQNANKAEFAASEAIKAKEETESAAEAFNNDTTFIFDGGNALSEVDARFIVDTSMSNTSTNAVQNKVVKEYIDNKCPVGTVWIGGKNGDTPIDPSEIFGGEWKLIDKEFASVALSDDGTGGLLTMSDKVGAYVIYCIYGGHTIRFRIGFTPTVVFDDNEAEIGQLNFEKIGVNSFWHSFISVPAMSDPSNGLVMTTIGNTGKIVVNDVIKANTPNNIIYAGISITCRGEDMLDSFCDKFYWVKKSDQAKE